MSDLEVRVKHVKPCGEFPYRRASWSGYTGANPPQWYVDTALADFTGYGLAPCHTTATLAEPLGVSACAGALIFAANSCKSPRDPERAAAIRSAEQDHEAVFTRPQELIDHHTGPRSIRSWERAA